MSTRRALSHLQSLVELDERASKQVAALAATLKQVIAQIDAILDDSDEQVAEVLVDNSVGDEKELRLSRTPVKRGTVILYVNEKVVAEEQYEIEGEKIIPINKVPSNIQIRAEYVVEGLKTQSAALLAQMDDLDAGYFIERKGMYRQAINWIEENF